MKKIFLFAAAAALLTACSSEELSGVDTVQQNADGNAINFSVYTQRNVTRAGVGGETTDALLKDGASANAEAGFGIMAYYTNDEKYSKETSKPNFMYNTQVTYSGSKWVYNPVMYWPNEFQAARAHNVDYVSFFAYAPYIDVENSTGIPVLKELTTDADYDAIAATIKAKYTKFTEGTLDANKTSYITMRSLVAPIVDLSAAADAAIIADAETFFGITLTDMDADSDIDIDDLMAYITSLPADAKKYYHTPVDKYVTTLATYMEYTGLSEADAKAALKEIQKDQVQGRNITELNANIASGDPIVKYVVDTNPATSVDLLWGVAANTTDYTPIEGTSPVAVGMPFVNLIKPKKPADDKLTFNLKHATAKLNVQIQYVADQLTPTTTSPVADADVTSDDINADQTRIYVRSIKIGGFVMKGALNLNNTTAEKPLWKSYEGNTALAYTENIFTDGRKDGREGFENGKDASETNIGLNPDIIENYSPAAWPLGKTPGVGKTAVNLFGYDDGTNKTKPIFVIPTEEDIDIEIIYDVETADPNLSTFLSDGLTHGSSVENKIRKTSAQIFGATKKMEPGKGYIIKILLGMTSVKFEAIVVDSFGTGTVKDVDLPDNQ